MKKQSIDKLWKQASRQKYQRVNKKDGSMPTFNEFKKIMQE